MEAFGKRRTGGNLSAQLLNGKVGRRGGANKRTGAGLNVASANVDIPKENRVQRRIPLQPARNHDEFRTEKLKHLKTMVLRGEYDIDPRKVAQSFLRAAIPWPGQKRLIQSIIIELTEILSLAERETVAGDEMSAQSRGPKEIPTRTGNGRPLIPPRCNIKPRLNDLSRKIPC